MTNDLADSKSLTKWHQPTTIMQRTANDNTPFNRGGAGPQG